VQHRGSTVNACGTVEAALQRRVSPKESEGFSP